MSSDRHGARGGRRSAVGLALVFAAGCFGDGASARPRSRTDAQGEATPGIDANAGEPAEPCPAYLAAVAAHCDAVLDGRMGATRCHAEIVRVMALFHEGDEPLYHQPPPAAGREGGAPGVAAGQRSPEEDRSRADACAGYLRSLPEPEVGGATPELGPACREWAQAVRERCVAPLATIPPDLRACGPDLSAFEGTLAAITFGQAQDHEPRCREAVERLRSGASG